MKPFDYEKYLRNNPLLKEEKNEQLNETDFKEITGKLTSALESMGYEVEYEPSYYGYPSISADKPIGEGHLRVWIQPSQKEKDLYRDKYKDDPTGPTKSLSYSTVDVEFILWKPEVVKKFFGLFKSKKLKGANFPEESGMDIDLGSGMFNIPIEDSVNRIISVVKKGEQKAMSMMGMNEMDVEPEV